MDDSTAIRVFGARQHNLRDFDVEIPLGKLTVITGVSGSGKSSLAYDTLFREGQRRYLESVSSYARQSLGKLERPDVDRIEGIPAALAVDQRAVVRSPRSTVGTLGELYDHLRLLFARVGRFDGGDPAERITSSLLSFNSPLGACEECKGLGVQDRVDPDLLIADPARTLREGALVPTTPTGYIVYSQVTVDVLDRVCRAHGFTVDLPWRELSPEQQRVVLYGSDRIRVPFGKHPLESRMKWKGITAKPREEGHYGGIVPVIEEILKRNRNRNALRFVRSEPCEACGGARLNPRALTLKVGGSTIADVAARSVGESREWLTSVRWDPREAAIAGPVVDAFAARAEQIAALGLGHLRLDRASPTLSTSEVQRLRLARAVGVGMRGVLYVLDEPSVGLHGRDHGRLMAVLWRLRDAGNTVVVVEHDEATIRAADHVIEIGPEAGVGGGELVYAGAPREGTRREETRREGTRREGAGTLWVRGAREHNLRGIDVPLRIGALNVVTGVSGAGKTTLVEGTLGRALRAQLHGATAVPGVHEAIEGAGSIDKVIVVDQAPIGRTPRSNPATYTKVFDPIRTLFASTDLAKERGWGKGHFSLNVKGGRCETCQGAGVETVGMHFLGDVQVTCPECGGRRFGAETLRARHAELSVLDVLELSVDDAAEVFADQPKIRRVLGALQDVGLGYLSLGQPSTTLSGGEAQRVKLAAELGRRVTGHTLLLLDEPTRGLHRRDVDRLLDTLNRLVDRGNTAVVVEHDPQVICAADHVVDLGPEAGDAGGDLVVAGPPEVVRDTPASVTGAVLRGEATIPPAQPRRSTGEGPIQIRGATTHNLRAVDVDIPHGRMTVVTGVSGSGKSSLAFDTLHEEARARYAEGLTTQVRRRTGGRSAACLDDAHGLTPTLGIGQGTLARNPRSTVGTMTEIHESMRLLFARAGQRHCTRCGSSLVGHACSECGHEGAPTLLAAHFSFNDHRGACPTCRGLGHIETCDPEALVSDPMRSLAGGALDGHRAGKAYGDPRGRHMAILEAVAAHHDLDFSPPYVELGTHARDVALRGTGDREYDVVWRYERGARKGSHEFRATWDGLVAYVDEEYDRKHADHRGDAMRPLMMDVPCGACGGGRLGEEPRAVRFAGRPLDGLLSLSVEAFLRWLDDLPPLDTRSEAIARPLLDDVRRRLRTLADVGLGYLTLDRSTPSLSSGEAHRVRLAAQLSARLQGITYVLDEPTSGLHPRDTERLLSVLRQLRAGGNTLVVVEHDLGVIRAADHVIDLGPGPGDEGGRVVAEGSPEQLALDPGSPTGVALAQGARAVNRQRREPRPGLHIEGAHARNLRKVDVQLPADALVAVTGVSGSGKSALLFEVVRPSLTRRRPVACAAIHGADRFDEVVAVDGTQPRRDARTTVASLCGVFDPLRTLFAKTDGARVRGWRKGWFSLHARGGRCEICGGTGREDVEMGFLPTVRLPCDACAGARFAAETLEARHDGASIADVLAMTVQRAVELLAGQRAIRSRLQPLLQLGLGYLTLGQAGDTLSGGEVQRLTLAHGLASAGGDRRLYLLDEPTRGLHVHDVRLLVGALDRLVDAGHTVWVIEHDLAVIGAADWLVDLGPEGGAGGGVVVAEGAPETVAAHPTSHTGVAYRAWLEGVIE
jgi:excinuclease ABC subunit A